jgi:hypothetical protein
VKYLIEFSKTGRLIYISHLDLARLFLRVLRMAGLRPDYSAGFNPHPKMSFALPLSLGFHSVCEYLEIETGQTAAISPGPENGKAGRESAAPAALRTQTPAGRLNERLPEGIRVTGFCEKPVCYPKSLASYVHAARYEIMCEGIDDAPARLAAFFAQSSITVRKEKHKTGKVTENDIRGAMLDYRVVKDLKGRMLAEVTLLSGGGAVLNPLVFFDAFCAHSGQVREALAPVVTRQAILGKDGRPLLQKPGGE